MSRISNVVTVPGTTDGRGHRTVAYTLILDNGTRSTHTLQVTGDRDRVRQLLASAHDVPPENITFDPHYDD